MTTDHLREHEEMIVLANDIMSFRGSNCSRQIGDLARMRLAFARLVNKHCREEAQTVERAVARGLLCQNVVTSFERELTSWRAELAACNSEWPLTRALKDPVGFKQRFGKIATALRDFIARENVAILAAIDQRASVNR